MQANHEEFEYNFFQATVTMSTGFRAVPPGRFTNKLRPLAHGGPLGLCGRGLVGSRRSNDSGAPLLSAFGA